MAEEASGEDAAVVEYQEISWVKVLGQVVEAAMVDRAVRAGNDQESGVVADRGRPLRDQFLGSS